MKLPWVSREKYEDLRFYAAFVVYAIESIQPELEKMPTWSQEALMRRVKLLKRVLGMGDV